MLFSIITFRFTFIHDDSITLTSKSFESIADQTEPWYGGKYKVETISDDLINKVRHRNLT